MDLYLEKFAILATLLPFAAWTMTEGQELIVAEIRDLHTARNLSGALLAEVKSDALVAEMSEVKPTPQAPALSQGGFRENMTASDVFIKSRSESAAHLRHEPPGASPLLLAGVPWPVETPSGPSPNTAQEPIKFPNTPAGRFARWACQYRGSVCPASPEQLLDFYDRFVGFLDQRRERARLESLQYIYAKPGESLYDYAIENEGVHVLLARDYGLRDDSHYPWSSIDSGISGYSIPDGSSVFVEELLSDAGSWASRTLHAGLSAEQKDKKVRLIKAQLANYLWGTLQGAPLRDTHEYTLRFLWRFLVERFETKNIDLPNMILPGGGPRLGELLSWNLKESPWTSENATVMRDRVEAAVHWILRRLTYDDLKDLQDAYVRQGLKIMNAGVIVRGVSRTIPRVDQPSIVK